jgi:hypothetical protein
MAHIQAAPAEAQAEGAEELVEGARIRAERLVEEVAARTAAVQRLALRVAAEGRRTEKQVELSAVAQGLDPCPYQ